MRKIIVVILGITLLSSKQKEEVNQYPFDSGNLICVKRNFGRSIDPLGWRTVFYEGVLFELKSGTEIYSLNNGVVETICDTCRRKWGNFVRIRENDSISYVYYHLNEVYVKLNQNIKKGQLIGVAGNSGRTTINGLGFRVEVNDTIINPNEIINKTAPNN